jgi:hypothetical protein
MIDFLVDGFFQTNTKRIYLPILDIDNTHKHYNYDAGYKEQNHFL